MGITVQILWRTLSQAGLKQEREEGNAYVLLRFFSEYYTVQRLRSQHPGKGEIKIALRTHVLNIVSETNCFYQAIFCCGILESYFSQIAQSCLFFPMEHSFTHLSS